MDFLVFFLKNWKNSLFLDFGFIASWYVANMLSMASDQKFTAWKIFLKEDSVIQLLLSNSMFFTYLHCSLEPEVKAAVVAVWLAFSWSSCSKLFPFWPPFALNSLPWYLSGTFHPLIWESLVSASSIFNGVSGIQTVKIALVMYCEEPYLMLISAFRAPRLSEPST